MYFASCVHDACACGENDPSCLCDTLEAYAAQCRRSGVIVRWRTAQLCGKYHLRVTVAVVTVVSNVT